MLFNLHLFKCLWLVGLPAIVIYPGISSYIMIGLYKLNTTLLVKDLSHIASLAAPNRHSEPVLVRISKPRILRVKSKQGIVKSEINSEKRHLTTK